MRFKLAVGLGALLILGLASAHAAPPPNITQTVGVCDPNYPKHCAAPDASGNLPITGTISATTSATASATPTPVTAGPGKPLNIGLYSDLFETLTDGVGNTISPMPKTGGSVGISGTPPVTQSGLWNVGGYSFFIPATPTIQNASYVSGNCMGGFQAVTVTGTTGATGTLHAFSITSKGGLLTAKQVYVFSQNPSASTCTDKSTFTINTADWSKLITTFSITPAAATGTTGTYADNTSMGRAFATSGNGNLYVAIVETTTETPASTTDLTLTLGGYIDKP